MGIQRAHERFRGDFYVQAFDLGPLRGGQGFRRDMELYVAERIGHTGKTVALLQLFSRKGEIFFQGQFRDLAFADLDFAALAAAAAALALDVADAASTNKSHLALSVFVVNGCEPEDV